MKIFKYLLLSCLFLVTNDALSAAAAAAPANNVLNKQEVQAVQQGDVEVVRLMVESRGINLVDGTNNPILVIALDMGSIHKFTLEILSKKIELAKYLILEGANIESKNEFGLTPLLLAVNRFMPNFTEFSSSVPDHFDKAGLRYEFNQLRFDFIEFLIGKNANLNAVDGVEGHDEEVDGPRRNFLMMAIENGDTELVERLCSLGVITQAMYEAAIEVYQKNNKANAQAARPSWLDAVSLPVNAQTIAITIKDPNAESAAAEASSAGGAVFGAAMAAGDAAQKEAHEVLDPKQQVIAVMTTYFTYANGRELVVRVAPNMTGSDGDTVVPLVSIVASYVVSPMKKNVNATATSEA